VKRLHADGMLARVHEAERRLLARELHDDLSQKLAALSMEASAPSNSSPESPGAIGGRIRDLGQKIGGLADDVQLMSRQLHPAILDDLGLEAALREECTRCSQRLGIPVRFQAEDVPRSLPGDIALCLFRVAQESLRNIRKHANAREVRVLLARRKTDLALWVEDIGDGFDIEQARGKRGLGLISMEERVRLVKGDFKIHSQPWGGNRSRGPCASAGGGVVKRWRLLLADDHDIVLAGLRLVLDQPDFEIVGTVTDGRALVQATGEPRPDVIVTDITMPLLNGIDAARQVRKVDSTVKIIFLTMHPDIGYATEALSLGHCGYVLKSSVADELPAAIREVLRGRTYVAQAIREPGMHALQAPAHHGETASEGLTFRQREVLQMLAEGRSVKEIASTLNVSPRTVEFHKYRIM
jgi:DNA-binding NarL/FixJ family response regulator